MSGDGGGVYTSRRGFTELVNTIVADNTGDNCDGTITSLGHNLDSDGTCDLNASGDLPNMDPLLGPLHSNGGPTLTHALLLGSPAIDAGDGVACPDVDQRGSTRPQGVACDIGAFELAGESWDILWSPPDPSTALMHQQYQIDLLAGNLAGNAQTLNFGLTESVQYFTTQGISTTPDWNLAEISHILHDDQAYTFNTIVQDSIAPSVDKSYAFSVAHDWNWIPPWSLSRTVDIAINFVPGNIATLKILIDAVQLYDALQLLADVITSAPEARYVYTGLADSTAPPFEVTVTVPNEKILHLLTSVAFSEPAGLFSSGGMGIGAATGWTGWGLIPAGALLVAEAYMLRQSEAFYIMAVDPTEDFMIPASPAEIVEPALENIPASLEKEIAELNVKLFALSDASAISYARYQGAVGVGALDWAAAQLATTELYLSQALDLLNEITALSDRIIADYPIPNPVEIDVIRDFLKTEGLPSIEVEVLGRLGYSQQEIADLTETILSSGDSYFTSFTRLTESLNNSSFILETLVSTLSDSPSGALKAKLDVDPNTLKLRSKGRLITSYIELPSSHSAADIDVSTVLLNGIAIAESAPSEVGDHDGDGILDLMVKFDRQDIASKLQEGIQTMLVTAKLLDGTVVGGADMIRVIP